MRRSLAITCLVVILAGAVGASEFRYTGPDLKVDYSGPVLVDNSQLLFTNDDARSFKVAEHLRQHAPNLLPLEPTINTWASLQGIHPRILILVLERYFSGANTTGMPQDINMVYEITAGLAEVFWSEYDHPLAATRALIAVGRAYDLRLAFPDELSTRRALAKSRGTVNPFGYFQPPWPIGQSWWGGGAHGDTGSGAMNALDFGGPHGGGWGTDFSDSWVSAMQDGDLYVYSVCSLAIFHEDGWKTTYYHVENPQFAIGGPYAVTRNTPLANIANDLDTAICQGGSSTGPHVHQGFTRNGVREIVDESNLDYTAFSQHSSTTQYDFNCSTSWYNHFTLGTLCPGYLNLLNDVAAPDAPFFSNGFETGNFSGWSTVVY